MLTPEQEKWIAHLSNQDHIKILPFDSTAQEKFEVVKRRIEAAFGHKLRVLHRGATSLGISGQDEIDVYVPVPEEQFNSLLAPLTAVFGNPRSHYPLERARFVTSVEGKHIDIFLINEACQGWLDGVKFDRYLRTHPENLDQYRLLKESLQGSNMREYYLRKTEFFNQILSMADQE